MNTYLEFKKSQQDEINNFPMFFAFSQEQLNKGMEKLELKPTDTNKILSIGAGGFIKKANKNTFTKMFKSRDKAFKNKIAADKTGEGFIFDMFNYELANHEYCVTMSTFDTFEALGISLKEVNDNKALLHGLKLAIAEQWDSSDY